MELELGLGLSSKIGVDLNSSGCDLALHLSSPIWSSAESTPQDNGGASRSKKRSFEEFVEENRIVPQTLPLLLWDNPPNRNNNIEDLVGWPPVRTWRTKKLHRCGGGGGVRTPTNSKFVKVKMEGVAIARKIDLALYHSLETLMTTLKHMFSFGSENSSGGYELAFQDCNKEWLLAEVMPWRTVVGSVERLKLMTVGACSTNQ